MATRLNRSQVEMLIKRRNHLSDQQLSEMMKSRNVFHAQIELRKELERANTSLQHAQKIIMANLNCQKAMFLKRVSQKKKSLRYLVSVEIHLKGTGSSDDDDDDDDDNGNKENEDVDEETPNDGGFKSSNALTSVTRQRTVSMNKGTHHNLTSTSTPNEKWMKAIRERSKRALAKHKATSTSTKDADDRHIMKKGAHRSTLEETSLKTHTHIVHDTHSSLQVEQTKMTTSINENSTSNDTFSDLIKPQQTKDTHYRSMSSFSLRIRSSSFQNSQDNQPRRRAITPNFKCAPLLDTTNRALSREKIKPPIRGVQTKPIREKTIKMLFVERQDDGDWPSVSPFDVEAWIQQNRRKRGHSIVLSTAFLRDSNQIDFNQSTEVPVLSKPRQDSVKPIQQRPLRFRRTKDQPNVRQRGNDWFMSFAAEKNNKKLSSRERKNRLKDSNFKQDGFEKITHLSHRKLPLPPILGTKHRHVADGNVHTK